MNEQEKVDFLINQSKKGVRISKFGIVFCWTLSIIFFLGFFIIGFLIMWAIAPISLFLSIIIFSSIFAFKKALKVSRQNIETFTKVKEGLKKNSKKKKL
jgi:ABC-type multidrug transport system fused ATPase/permease subunit